MSISDSGKKDLRQTILDSIASKYGHENAMVMEKAYKTQDKQIEQAMNEHGLTATDIAQTRGIDLSQFASQNHNPNSPTSSVSSIGTTQGTLNELPQMLPSKSPFGSASVTPDGNIQQSGFFAGPFGTSTYDVLERLQMLSQIQNNNRKQQYQTPEQAAQGYAYAQSIAPPGTTPEQSSEGRISYKQSPASPSSKFIGTLGDVSNKTPEEVKLALEQKDPAYAKLLKNINDGKYDLGSRSTNQSLKIVEDAGLLYPELDLSTARARYKTRQDFTSGKTATNIKSFNTAIDHLGEMVDLIPTLKSSGFKQGNRLNQFISRQSGKTGVARFKLTQQALSGELATLFKNSGGTDQEISAIADSIQSSDSPENLRDVAIGGINLMLGRMGSVDNQWKSAFGDSSSFDHLISKRSQKTLSRLGIQTDLNSSDTGYGSGQFSNMTDEQIKAELAQLEGK